MAQGDTKKYIKPWRFDSQGITNRELSRTYIYRDDIIDDFLDPDPDNRLFFLVGPKGCGKTLLIHYKAYLYFNSYEDDRNNLQEVNASRDLVESLDFSEETLTQVGIKELQSVTVWNKVWEFAIMLVVLRKSKVGLPEELKHIEKQFRNARSLSTIVVEVINNIEKYVFSDFFSCRNAMRDRLDDLQQSYVMFVDRLDQALDSLLLNEDYKYLIEDAPDTLYLIWRNAQYALLRVAYSLNTKHKGRVRIYSTAREDALTMPTQEAINIKDYCVRLKYSKEALKEIFIHNVAAMRERELRGKQGDSPFMRFFGFDKIRHVAACDKHGEAQTESVFDFILRHTFHRPREIVMIGKRLYDKFNRTAEVKLPVTDNLIESIREQVNDVAWSEILHGYKQEFILGFRNDYVQQFVTNIVSNAADRSTLLRKVSREATDYLYRVGLLGSIDGKVQRFVPGSTFAFRKERVLPHSGWYVLHPTLDRELQGLGDVKKWYYQHSIIGDECSFETPDVVSWNLNRGYPVDYFRPKKIAGAQDWSGTRIQVDPLALYNGIFINGVRKNKLMRQQHERINESIQFLAVIAQLEAAKAVAGKFNKDMDFRIKTLRNQAMNLRGNTRYSSQITTTDATGLNLFTDRCFGRMVVMGLLLFLRFSIVEARNCVTSFSDKRLANPGEPETAIRFLRRSFFIYGLPGEGRLSSLDKMSILEKASDFERDCLPKWWRDYFLHSLLFNSNYNDEHRRYLREYFEFK